MLVEPITKPITLHPKVQKWQFALLGFVVGFALVILVYEEHRTWANIGFFLTTWLYLYLRLSTVLFSLKSHYVVWKYNNRIKKS